ncbi:bifunctional helix-turn-helix transcriptional regulator/GNAT family N-acetyltransferase [Streptosporangiaceae bacterium NEAU-GS5]|nr:bifunctional helix-turn-helix transcriptional regulator/GNAT family N-acetyltransferase [Streptosporangiaceae bacterium NEAU-GS5]
MDAIAEVRAFNRFYTEVVGVLRAGMVGTPYSLSEARVLRELAHETEVAEVRRLLGLDAGYLSRILARLESDGLIERERSAEDGRRQVVALTDQGRDTFEKLDERTAAEVEALLAPLTTEEQEKLVASMRRIRELLDRDHVPGPYVVIRPLKSGDLGWALHRHGVIYQQDYGWGPTFEALTARILADYAAAAPEDRSGWIAEVDGEPVGCVFCVRRDAATAQLRLLLVEPSARGLGIGGRLVAECVRYARESGYKQIMLWTRDVLGSARKIYQAAGFELVSSKPGAEGPVTVVDQVWELDLTPGTGR